MDLTPPTSDPAPRSKPMAIAMPTHGLWSFESRHDANFDMPASTHEFLELLWFREGAGRLEIGELSRPFEAGGLALVPPRQLHRIIDAPESPSTLIGLGIDLNVLPCARPIVPSQSSEIVPPARLRSLRIEPRLRKVLYLNRQDSPPHQVAAIAATLELLADIALLAPTAEPGTPADDDTTDPLLEAYVRWLDRNFFEPVSLQQAADASRLSRRSFSAQFKRRTGATWLQYLTRLRIEYAESLMQQRDRKVTSIAFQCGYDDLSTFYRAYKRVRGHAPGMIRGRSGND